MKFLLIDVRQNFSYLQNLTSKSELEVRTELAEDVAQLFNEEKLIPKGLKVSFVQIDDADIGYEAAHELSYKAVLSHIDIIKYRDNKTSMQL